MLSFIKNLTKPKTVDIADSNIANLGTDLEKKARLDAAQKEPAWEGVGSKVGLKVFRIEQFKVVPVSEDKVGKFYNGDSYIVINTWKKADEDKLYHDIHFWLGAKSSQDEQGTAAYKTVELDDYLGTVPVEHREVQGDESALFKSYFKSFEVLEGGVASGFKHVTADVHVPHLYKISLHSLVAPHKDTGITINEVAISYKSLNSGDVFVLDAEKAIYAWIGSHAKGIEKLKAQEVARRIESEREGRANVVVFDENDTDAAAFWEALGGKGPITSAADAAKAAEKPVVEKALIRLTDRTEGAKLSYKVEATNGSIKKSQLDSNDVFIVDNSDHVYVWVGSNSSDVERKNAMKFATDYLAAHSRPLSLPVTRVVEGVEDRVPSFVACLA
ncbi:actin depolymerizing protein [Rhizoclosmatium globosum]|uniref:Actin depolymerizing protein n=1 Tax=Rhizoclosmatium globosum TaxID=329046 RepID=A0A1Y2CN13_9FUNG|nr:actin depolymerizing protein [Rhizoclosmatium globosum]|eukprot:ORY48326.1 actin depolymerizing protein [Rhizoclosmatium globosum]